MERTQEVKRKSKYYDEYPNRRIRECISKQYSSYKKAAESLRKSGVEVSDEAVRQWCDGYSRPDIGKLVAIAMALNCSLNYLFGIDEYTSMELSDISRKTGLSDEAIAMLQTIQGNEKLLLNQLLSDPRLCLYLSYWVASVNAALDPAPTPHKGMAAPVVAPSVQAGYYTVAGDVASSLFMKLAIEDCMKPIMEDVTAFILSDLNRKERNNGNT